MLLEQQISILEWFLKCNNISQYYCFYCIFDLINAAMVNVRDVFQKQNKMVWLLTFEQKCDRNTWHVKHPCVTLIPVHLLCQLYSCCVSWRWSHPGGAAVVSRWRPRPGAHAAHWANQFGQQKARARKRPLPARRLRLRRQLVRNRATDNRSIFQRWYCFIHDSLSSFPNKSLYMSAIILLFYLSGH